MENEELKTEETEKKKAKPDVSALLERLEKLEHDNTILKSIAGKNAIASWEERLADKTVKKMSLKVVDGKVVKSWENIIQKVYRNDNGIYQEEWTIRLTFEDGTTKDMQYDEFIKLRERKDYLVRGSRGVTETDRGGNPVVVFYFTLEDENGQTFEVRENYVNLA
jgi:hypothetical protein